VTTGVKSNERNYGAAEFAEIPEMSNITETVDLGVITHSMSAVIPERFCSADISSEGDMFSANPSHCELESFLLTWCSAVPPNLADHEPWKTSSGAVNLSNSWQRQRASAISVNIYTKFFPYYDSLCHPRAFTGSIMGGPGRPSAPC